MAGLEITSDRHIQLQGLCWLCEVRVSKMRKVRDRQRNTINEDLK